MKFKKVTSRFVVLTVILQLFMLLIVPISAFADSDIELFANKILKNYGFDITKFIDNPKYTVKFDVMEDVASVFSVSAIPYLNNNDGRYENLKTHVDLAFTQTAVLITSKGVQPFIYTEIFMNVLCNNTPNLEKMIIRVDGENFDFSGEISQRGILNTHYIPAFAHTYFASFPTNSSDFYKYLENMEASEARVRFVFSNTNLDVIFGKEVVDSIRDTLSDYIDAGLLF